ncbi:lytic murein transglycosylase [Candidatus Woesearchaeota archaeon]|nr:lytic murein transglycosylase [Candidatus Woesearchaeota archaeon]
MGVSKLKKAVLCGALALGLGILPANAQNQSPNSSNPYKYKLPANRDPFVPAIKYLPLPEVKTVIELENIRSKLVKDGFDNEEIMRLYLDDRFSVEKSIIHFFSPSTKAISARKKFSYDGYRKLLALDDKISKAPAFMHKYIDDLCLAESMHGVDRRYIAAIKGIESDYGKNLGKYLAFNALISMYLGGRKELAYNELKEYLAYCEKNQKGIYDFTSSYAGAIGCAQFMPSSLNRLFIGKKGDFDADPMNMIDSIYSSAYYLKQSGWDPSKNNIIPTPGSANWKALWDYNHSAFYVQAVIEIANKSKWNESDLKYVRKHEKIITIQWENSILLNPLSKILKGTSYPFMQSIIILAPR